MCGCICRSCAPCVQPFKRNVGLFCRGLVCRGEEADLSMWFGAADWCGTSLETQWPHYLLFQVNSLDFESTNFFFFAAHCTLRNINDLFSLLFLSLPIVQPK